MDVRRARRVKIGLAGLAVLGVGAALTSAAWTDVVFFDADVTTGNFNLQGALPADQAAPVGAAGRRGVGGVRRHHGDHADTSTRSRSRPTSPSC